MQTDRFLEFRIAFLRQLYPLDSRMTQQFRGRAFVQFNGLDPQELGTGQVYGDYGNEIGDYIESHFIFIQTDDLGDLVRVSNLSGGNVTATTNRGYFSINVSESWEVQFLTHTEVIIWGKGDNPIVIPPQSFVKLTGFGRQAFGLLGTQLMLILVRATEHLSRH